MAKVPVYQQQRTIPGTTGQQMAPLSLVGESPMKGVADAALGGMQMLAEAGQRINAREALITKARVADEYKNNELQEYTAFLDTADMLDPKSIDQYSIEAENRLSKTLMESGLSGDGLAELEAALRGQMSGYKGQVITKANSAQRQFILGKIQEGIEPIVSGLMDDPSGFRGAFGSIDAIVDQYAHGIDTGTEMTARDASYSLVMERSIGGLINRGKWDEANQMLQDNPILSKYMTAAKKSQFDAEIQAGLLEKTKVSREMIGRQQVLSNLQDMGYAVDPSKAGSFVAGFDISPDMSYAQETDEILTGLGIDPLTANTRTRAAVRGIEIPGSVEIDPNKDKYIDGNGVERFTAQGVSKMAAPYIEEAVAVDTQLDGMSRQFASYESGNELAGLGIIQTYLKMIDDGAVVRDSDIALAERSTSFYEQMQRTVSQYSDNPQAVPRTLVEQARTAGISFAQQSLERSKAFIDGYVADTNYSVNQFGLPGDTYNSIFSNVRTAPLNTVTTIGGESGELLFDPNAPVISTDADYVFDLNMNMTGRDGVVTPSESASPEVDGDE